MLKKELQSTTKALRAARNPAEKQLCLILLFVKFSGAYKIIVDLYLFVNNKKTISKMKIGHVEGNLQNHKYLNSLFD